MTIQDLKENRNLIIETIESLNLDVKQVMNEMVSMLGYNGIKSTDVISYTKEVVSLLNIQPKAHVNTLWGAGCKYSTQAEYQRSCLGSKFN